jgi:hypothetical protein
MSAIGDVEDLYETDATPDGKSIPPTGTSFKLVTCTVGHWTKAGVMDEECLFWDNATYMKQLGIGK